MGRILWRGYDTDRFDGRILRLVASCAVRARSLIVAVATSAVLGLPVSLATAHHAPGPCDIHRGEGEGVRHFSKRLIHCAVDRFGPVHGGASTAICIARRESGLWPDAESLTSMYQGLYQHSAEYWPHRYQTWTLKRWDLSDSALSGRTNAVVTIRMVESAGSWLAAGWKRVGC